MKHFKAISAAPRQAITAGDVGGLVVSIFAALTGLIATIMSVSVDARVKNIISQVDPNDINVNVNL